MRNQLLLLLAAFGCLAAMAPASAEDVQERVVASCRTGMEPSKEAGFLAFPNATEAEKAEAEAAYQVQATRYCGCVAKSVPISNLEPKDITYVYYMLENVAVERNAVEQKLSLAWNGLDEDRLALIAHSFTLWTSKCY